MIYLILFTVALALLFGGLDALVNCAGTAEPEGSSILSITSTMSRW